MKGKFYAALDYEQLEARNVELEGHLIECVEQMDMAGKAMGWGINDEWPALERARRFLEREAQRKGSNDGE